MTPPPMATDDARQATEVTEFRQKLDTMVATAMKKKYDAARARVLAALIEPPLPMPP
jgi:hypothetical protein